MRSRVELFEAIRRDRRVQGLSIRALAERHGVHRRTVRQALERALPPRRKGYARRRCPAIDPYAAVVDGWLLADQRAPRKQRHTARRVWQRLVAEHGAVVAEVTVSRYVARRRMELGLDRVEVMVPQTHPAGAEAEVDFGEFYTTIAGVWTKCWMFVLRLSHSGKAFHVAFGTQAQEAFLEGHVLAFAHFGAVPARIRYDNLKPAVIRVLRGRDRTESERFIALRSHYSFDSFFCVPGKEGAHEKGGVEGEIGRFRRRHGLLCGLVNGLVVVLSQLPPVLVTLGMYVIVQGIALGITDGAASARGPVTSDSQLTVWIAVGAAFVAHTLLTATRHGRYTFFVGSNPRAAELSGIRVNRVRLAGYVASGVLAGLAGALAASESAHGPQYGGVGLELTVFAAVVLGGARLSGGRGSVLGTVLGVVLLILFGRVMAAAGLNGYWQQCAFGVVLLVASAVNEWLLVRRPLVRAHAG